MVSFREAETSRKAEVNTRGATETQLVGGLNRPNWKHMGISKNSGIPKWMVHHGKPIKMGDLGVPLFSETPIYASPT